MRVPMHDVKTLLLLQIVVVFQKKYMVFYYFDLFLLRFFFSFFLKDFIMISSMYSSVRRIWTYLSLSLTFSSCLFIGVHYLCASMYLPIRDQSNV